ncbi:hypothetical protein JIN85_13465 [Luteolibacter pohnpeiensis]|uniref:Secreted protein n=1 Tax=Luteolibacter pohnpeiensis TaxID=454153 RepID=A0A934VXE0_9BACT|nr:hypothetical protein [Luteolibacter pohnpeiensis]MBK1883429.1 hypothetical protein [Luteolibacter pohnpeiensis]
MIPSKRQLLLFTAASVLTAAIWTAFQTQQKPVEDSLPMAAKVNSSVPDIGEFLTSLQAANTDAERYRVTRTLEKIPLSQIQATLESIPLKENSGLTQPAKLLLNRWGSEDGEAATEWAWIHLRMKQLWHDAFVEIGPAWAWADPEGLAAWAITTQCFDDSDDSFLSLAKGAELEHPVLERGLISKIAQWLVTDSAELAFKVLIQSGTLPSAPNDIIYKRLNRVEDVKEALLAFDLTKEPSDDHIEDAIKRLLMCWQNIDAESFAQSEYADRFELPPYEFIGSDVIMITPPSTTSSPTPYPQATNWYSNYERWKYSNGPMPDMSNWSAGKMQAWEDLQALLPESSETD